MNFLDTTKTGGHPLILEDFGFIQDGIKEQLSGAFAWMNRSTLSEIVFLEGGSPFGVNEVTSGFAIVNEDFILDAGGGELMLVQALATNPDLSVFDYYIEDIPDPTLDPTTYLDASSKDVHIKRQLVPRDRTVVGFSGVRPVDFAIDKTIALALENKLINDSQLIENMRDLIYDTLKWSSATTDATYATVETLQVIKEGDTVRMRGRIEYTNGSGATVATGIPASMRPATDKSVGIDIFDSATGKILVRAHAVIKTTGAVEFSDTDYGTITGTDILVFDGSFYKK